MKREKLLKIALVIIMGAILLAMSVNVYGLSDDDMGLDLTPNTNTNTSGGAIDLTPTTNNTNSTLDTTTNTNTNTNTNANANTNNNYNTNLPDAGVAENTVMGIALTVLVIIAIYAYTRIKYYKNV